MVINHKHSEAAAPTLEDTDWSCQNPIILPVNADVAERLPSNPNWVHCEPD